MKRFILPIAMVLFLVDCTRQDTTTTATRGSAQKYSTPVFADSASFTRLKQFFPIVDSLFIRYAKTNHFPSIAYGIVVGNQLVHANATGIANIKENIPASTRSLYRIASMSKSFTAMAILRLRDGGKLSLGDPVSKHIPDFKGAGALTTDAPPVTILNLLSMSAGFPEDNPWGDRQLEDTDQDLLDQVRNGVSYSNVPGVAYEYSNLGFALLGRIITNVSGTQYQQYITENIMRPIGMSDSKWEYSQVPSDVLALGYRWEDEQWKEEPMLHDGSYGAMGGLICSIEDFAKYVGLHLSAWPPRNEPGNGPVGRGSIREMHQPQTISGFFPNAKNRAGEPCPVVAAYCYGLGWREDCNGTVRIAHSGGLPGFGSQWAIYPEFNIGVVSFSNHTYGAPSLTNSIVLDTLIALAGLKKRELPPSEILRTRKEQIMRLLPDWNEEQKEIFAENFYLDLDVEHRRKQLQSVLNNAGKMVKVNDIVALNQLRGTFTIEYEKKKISVFFTLSPEPSALIQQLDFE